MAVIVQPARVEPASKASRLSVLRSAKGAEGATMDEALDFISQGKPIATNKRLSQAMIRSMELNGVLDALPCWSGTLVCYVEPGKTFFESSEVIPSLDNGNYIIYTEQMTGNRYLFQVPDEHIGAGADCILVAEKGISISIEGKDRLVHADDVRLVKGFPQSNGRFYAEPSFDIPVVDGSGDASLRGLFRTDGVHIGLAVRDYGSMTHDATRTVLLNFSPSNRFGLIEEIMTEGPHV
jgi:hypothetical protein